MDFNEALALQKRAEETAASLKEQIAKTGWTDAARMAAAEARRRAALHGDMNEHHEVESERAANNEDHRGMNLHDMAGDEHRIASSDFSRAAAHFDQGKMRQGDKMYASANQHAAVAFSRSSKAHGPD